MRIPLDDASVPAQEPPDGVVIGRYLGGDIAGSVFDRQVILLLEVLAKHLAVFGQTGSGKTTTVERLIDQLARHLEDAQFFFLDAAADLDFACRFGATMEASGRTVRIFPHQRFNAWPQGDPRAVFNRLMKAIAFAETGAAKWYSDLSTVALGRACRMGGTPPRSSKELFERLHYGKLRKEYGRAELTGLEPDHVKAAFIRLMALYEHSGSILDGDWSCGDVDAAYFALDSLVLGESIGVIAYMLLSHIANYVKHEKAKGRICVVVIDEFASLASGLHNVAMFIEQVRKLGVYVIVISQTVAGMDSSRDLRLQSRRILNSVGAVVVHSTAEWEAVSHLLNRKLTPDLTLQYEGDDGAEPDRVRYKETPSVKPEQMLTQELGEAWLLHGGKSTHFKAALPDMSDHKEFVLPEPEELFLPLGLEEPLAARNEGSAPDFLSTELNNGGGFHRDGFEVPDSRGSEDGDDRLPDPEGPDPANREPGSGGFHGARFEIPPEFESGDQSDELADGDAQPPEEGEEGDDPSRPD